MNQDRFRKLNRFLIFVAVAIAAVATATLLTVRAGDEPVVHESTVDPVADWKSIPEILGIEGEMGPQVYTVTIERDDLEVQNTNGFIPPAAGLSHQFHFFRCPCGKMNVVGQFCVAEYEANDVMDALRATTGFKIVSVAPMLLEETPRIVALRFQGEGGASELAKTLKSALEWTGEARMAPSTQAAESE